MGSMSWPPCSERRTDDEEEPVLAAKEDAGLASTALKLQCPDGRVRVLSSSEENLRKKTVTRLVAKNGRKMMRTRTGLKIGSKKMLDLFTTIMEYSWPALLLLICSSYFLCWTVFGALWHLLAVLHGDVGGQTAGRKNCVYGINNFVSSFLMSIELQQTIGYGERAPTDECFESALLQGFQSFFGGLMDAALIGIFFAKISRPGTRARTVYWSKNAVVCLRDGVMCLVWRFVDIQQSQLLETHFRAQIRSTYVTQEGEVFNNYMRELKVSTQVCGVSGRRYEDRAVVVLPTQIIHPIDQDSPFYCLHPSEMASMDLELVVTMEAVVEPSGNTTIALSSYTPDELIWGWRFESCVDYDTASRNFLVDVTRINAIYQDEVTPWTAAVSATPLASREGVQQGRDRGRGRRSGAGLGWPGLVKMGQYGTFHFKQAVGNTEHSSYKTRE